MDPDSPQFQYVNGQMREHFADLFARFEQRNAQALQIPGWQLNLTYGPHAREVMDWLPAGQVAMGTVVYFHAGYWQSRDKSQFRFLAPGFHALGWDVALVNYPLCPDVGVADIVASARRGLRHAREHQRQQGRTGPVVLCGHSAGAHLAVELALDPAPTSTDALAGIVAISGVFDLRPLVHTSLNERLRLDEASARACSPVQRGRAGAAPALFVVGETETPAFHAQSQGMAQQWQRQGNTVQMHTAPGADHFSVLDTITQAQGLVARTLRAWAKG